MPKTISNKKRKISDENASLYFDGTYKNGAMHEGYIQCLVGKPFLNAERRRVVVYYMGDMTYNEFDGRGEFHILFPQKTSVSYYWKGTIVGGELGHCFQTNMPEMACKQLAQYVLENLHNLDFTLDRRDQCLMPMLHRLSTERAGTPNALLLQYGEIVVPPVFTETAAPVVENHTPTYKTPARTI